MKTRIAGALVFAVLAISGCSFGSDPEYGYDESVGGQEDYEQSEESLQDQAEYYLEQQRDQDHSERGWRCYWSPTMNDNWHDDYECSNGLDYDRPYLLDGDSFVERWEIDNAAADYESRLNK